MFVLPRSCTTMAIYWFLAKYAKKSIQHLLSTLFKMVSKPSSDDVPQELSRIPFKTYDHSFILVSHLKSGLSKDLARLDEADPRAYYVSKLGAYKFDSQRYQHEFVAATVKATPREDTSHTDQCSEYTVIFERYQSKVVINKVKAKEEALPFNSRYEDSAEFRHDVLEPIDEDSPLFNVSKTRCFAKSYDKLAGSAPASDQVSRTNDINDIPDDVCLLAEIQLNAPPMIPRNDVVSAIPKDRPILKWTDPEDLPHLRKDYMYLHQLVVLARAISNSKGVYTLFEHNCYWFAGMVIHCVRRYTGRDMKLFKTPSRERIGADEDARNLEGVLGTFKYIKIVKLPRNVTLDRMLERFSSDLHQFEYEVYRKRNDKFMEQQRVQNRILEAESREAALVREREAEKAKRQEAERHVEQLKAELEEVKRRQASTILTTT